MSKFDELKKAAEAAIEQEDCDRFIQRDDAQAVLELMAIQAQLVAALNLMLNCDGASGSFGKRVEAVNKATAALAAAGAQP